MGVTVEVAAELQITLSATTQAALGLVDLMEVIQSLVVIILPVAAVLLHLAVTDWCHPEVLVALV
jgi:hypothetical protein